MKTIKFIFVAVVAVLFAGTAQAQDKVFEFDSGAKLITRDFKEINKARYFEISAEYPELQGIDDAVAANFNELVKTRVMQDVDEFRRAMLEMDDDELNFARERGISNYTEIGYSIVLANADVVSLSFGNGSYTGGAHPNSYSFTINFDLKKGKEMKLADLFRPGSNYLKVISDYAIAGLKKQLESDDDDEWIARGAGPDAENFKSWTISQDGLKIEFDAYQVAAYVYGPQEITIPYNQLRSVLRALDFEPLRFANSGNPVNWCRNGLFPNDGGDFRVAAVRGRRNEKVFFYNDDKEACPDGPGCKRRSYLIPGDEVIVSRIYGNYGCAWYQPKKGPETVGWIRLERLSFPGTADNQAIDEWLGDWDFYDNSITIIRGVQPGLLKITGTAFWKGLGDNIHIGELDDSAAPNGSRLSFGASGEYDCRVKIQLLKRFLIVSDNLNCGGLNVTFNGVYRKK